MACDALIYSGDINDTAGWKVGYLAGVQGETLGKGLAAAYTTLTKAGRSMVVSSDGASGAAAGADGVATTTTSPTTTPVDVTVHLKPYQGPGFKAIFLIAGKHGGAGQLGSLIAGNFWIKMVKAKTVFYEKYWALFGLPAPKYE